LTEITSQNSIWQKVTDAFDGHLNIVVADEVFAAALCPFGGWPSGADGALVFRDAVEHRFS
jgi:hypothetical protein